MVREAVTLFALVRFPEHKPVAVLASAVVRHLPLGVDDWPLSNLYDAIARLESYVSSCLNKLDVSPLVAVVVDIVRDFAEQNTFEFQDPVCLLNKWGKGVSEGVTHFLKGSGPQAKSYSEILLMVLALVGNMRGIVHDYVKEVRLEGHSGVVGDHGGAVRKVYV
jgi:hypothetical protein